MQIVSPPITFDSLLTLSPSLRGCGDGAQLSNPVTGNLDSYTVPANRMALVLKRQVRLHLITAGGGVGSSEFNINVTKSGGSAENIWDYYTNDSGVTGVKVDESEDINGLLSAGDSISIDYVIAANGGIWDVGIGLTIIEFDKPT